jgi:hypothetical protein
MSGVQFDKKSAQRVASATKRVEAMPRGGAATRRGAGSSGQVVFFILVDALDAATNSLTDAAAARATVYASDPDNAPVMAADQSTYTPQELITSAPDARVEWVINRSIDMSGEPNAAGLAIRVNGELIVFWVDCTAGAS